jgi:anti-anti-sigma factor
MYNVTQYGDGCLIRVEHDLDTITSPSLASAIELAASGTPGRVIVSLERCFYCDASALTVLLRAKLVLGARFSIFVPHENRICRLFEITGLTQRLGLIASISPAGDVSDGSVAAGA